jgi:hypothetical protein
MAEGQAVAADEELDRDDRPSGDAPTAAEHGDDSVESSEPWPQLSPLELSVCLADAPWNSMRQRRSPTT